MSITEKQFRDTTGWREELRVMLENPILKTALAIIGETAKARGAVEPRPNTHLDTLVTHHYQKKAGIQAALDHLERLTEPNPLEDEQKDDDAEFFHSLPEPMKEAIRKSRQQ